MNSRLPAPRISIFNHKGGVGKTTLTFNIASAFGSLGHKVLLVDSDPQSNLTSFFVEDAVVDELIDESDSPTGNTIWSALKPIVEASGDVKEIEPYEMKNNIFLLPGDIKLSEFEEELPILWGECYQSKTKGYRGVSAISKLVNKLVDDYKIDFVFYDSGPNIGVLNRVILLDSDYFIVPAACDIFSLRAIKTLGKTLHDWIKTWNLLLQLAPSDMYVLPGKPVFLGYIPQRFKTYGGIITSDYGKLLPKLEKQINNDIVNQISKINRRLVYSKSSIMKLGDVVDFGQSATLSQVNGQALWELEELDKHRRNRYKNIFLNIAKKIISRIDKHGKTN